MLCTNGIEMLDLCLACGWAGAIAVPINVAARGPQLAHVLDSADPSVLAIDHDLVEHLDVVETDLPRLAQIWTIGDPVSPGAWRGTAISPLPDPASPAAAHPCRPQDPFAILFTSGTTGPPKGVICPHAQFWWWAVLTGGQLGLTASDRLYTVLPLFHTNAINTFWQALVAGATYVLGERFSASRFWSQLVEAEATVTYLLGTMVHILQQREPVPDETRHRVRIALAGATPADLVEAFTQRFGITLVDGYASTETNMVMSNWIDGHRPGTMGKPLEQFEAKVVDQHDFELPPGEPGELVIRHREPFSVASGYFGAAEATVEAWRNLWFHTGDRVVRDSDGVFRFLDRIKDAIRRRGENISSYEVEQALLSHPQVAAAAVVPVPSELSEDEVMAFVVPADGIAIVPEELIRHLEPRLAYFAIPRYLEFVGELPLTENGKVRKPVLRERGVGPDTWDREAAGYEVRR